MAIESINPATEEVMQRFDEATASQIEAALEASMQTFVSWRKTSFEHRAGLMRAAAADLRREKGRIGRLITMEMGKPIAEAEAEVEKCAWCCDYYAENADGYLADRADSRPAPPTATSPTTRSASCWRSCRGTSPSGRSSASPRRR